MPAPSPSDQAFVPFISVEHMMQLVHHIGIEEVLKGICGYLEDDFKRWEQFDKTPRLASHSKEGVIELMPTPDGQLYSFKYVNGHPKNTREGLQTVTAFGLLADVDTGYPMLLTEMTMLTALRTAATSAMVACHLAPRGARTMAMIGNGVQAEFQALAMKAICGIERLQLFDINPAATEKTVRNLQGRGFKITTCVSSKEAVEGADIITTCTADKQCATILTDDMMDEGVHINAIGGDCPGKTELQKEILERSEVFVEYTPQTRIEGDIQQMPEDFAVTEMWEVIGDSAKGRQDDKQITVFDGVGFAVEDFSTLRYVYDRLRNTNFYQQLDMIADPDDPRDLFGMLQRSRVGVAE